jgi:hypothetical protein
MDEKWMADYDKALKKLLAGDGYDVVGYIGYAAARGITAHALELSWYANISTRFHELRVSLPRDQFVCCVGCWRYDEKPRIFVKGAWLNNLYLRSHSVFALIDAIGVSVALERHELTRDKLLNLRAGIDAIGAKHKDISFISFADSLLLKSNWSVGTFDSEVRYSYRPEVIVRLIAELQEIYRSTLGLDIYAVITQGSNEFYDDPLLHVSETGNHISLNSLGLPFAQLMAIDHAARESIRERLHAAAELYIDSNFLRSLAMAHQFNRDTCPQGSYRAGLMKAGGTYYMASVRHILDSIRDPAP